MSPMINVGKMPQGGLLNCDVFPIQGTKGFHICQAHQVSRGANVRAIQEHPVYQDFPKETHPLVVSS